MKNETEGTLVDQESGQQVERSIETPEEKDKRLKKGGEALRQIVRGLARDALDLKEGRVTKH